METLSYLSTPEVSRELVTLSDRLKYLSVHQAKTEAFIFYDKTDGRKTITFGELYSLCRACSLAMENIGIKKGEMVVVALFNSMEFIAVTFGLMMIGAVPVNTLPLRKNASSLIHKIITSQAVAFVMATDNNVRQIDLCRLKDTLRDTTVKYFISTDIESDKNNWISLRRIMNNKKKESRDCKGDNRLDADSLALVMSTSGSTGPDKLVCHSYRNVYNMLHTDTEQMTRITKTDLRVFSPMPFSWLGGTPLREVINGITRVTLSGDKWKVSVKDVLHICEDENCNIMDVSHDFLNEIIFQNLPIPSSIKVILCGGAPMLQHFQTLLEKVPLIVSGYGLLETGGISAAIITKHTRVEKYIAGKPRAGIEVKVVDSNDTVVKRGALGNIKVKTPFSFLGYLGEPTANKQAWIDTKDVGHISKDGMLFVHGRQADCITIASLTTYASKFESFIADIGIPGMEDIVVVPIPDQICYQQACACIIRKPGSNLTEEKFRNTLDKEMAFDALKPKHVIFLESFPRNDNGKIDRNQLIDFTIKQLEVVDK